MGWFSTLACVATLAMASSVLGGCDAGSAEVTGSIGSVASYTWKGEVRSVHASWRVPEIREGSPCGTGGTWIGAIAEGGAFIQIGTNEECVAPTRRSDELPLEANYYSFWSDTSKDFHPKPLYNVQAGDRVEATLDVEHRRWHLTIVDETTGAKASFTTTEETQRQPYIAKWAQEDVELPNSYSPYPRLDQVQLSDVTVDGRAPKDEDLEPSTMSVGSELLAPTPLRDGSFVIGPSK
jgi:hypothetical protein